jgi:type IV pilus assembly protein PilX
MKHRHDENGMALVISLILLISLTLLALSSMRTSRVEFGMAGNLRESDTSFNAAEAGLRAAEQFIENSASTNQFDAPDSGLFAKTSNDPDYLDSATWEKSQTASTSLAYLSEQPKFVIKYLGDRSNNAAAAVNIGGYGKQQVGKTVSHFRITVRGLGQTPYATRYLQAHYGKEY